MDNKARQSSVTNASWPKYGSIEYFSYGEQVRLIMQCALMRYPHCDLTPGNIAAFKADWIDLLREVGTERFLTAVQRACQSSTFFPVIADIAKQVRAATPVPQYAGPSPEDMRRKAMGERSYGLPDVRCLSKLQQAARARVGGRSLTHEERDAALRDLDALIDVREKHQEQGVGAHDQA